MQSFRTGDGRTLAYRRFGAGPLLVCHPGGPGFSGSEFGDLAGLADSFTLVLLDPRGTGGSDPPADPAAYTLDGYAGDVDELRAHLGLERLNLLGFSHGGMVAMTYAASRPERVERLVLASTLARWGEAQEQEATRQIEGRRGEPWHEAATAALQAEAEGAYETAAECAELWKAMVPMYFARWDERARAFVEQTSDLGNADALKLFNAATPDLLAELGRIEAPTLVIAGEDDFVCGPASARELAAGIDRAELVLLPGAGHFTYYERPERFSEAVTSFLSDDGRRR